MAVLSLAAAAFAGAAPVRAQEPSPSPSPQVIATPDPMSAPKPAVDVMGFVDLYYSYNFNKVAPALRTFDVQHNAFSLSQAEVAFAKGVSPDSRVGFRIDVGYGKTANLVAAYEPEEGGSDIYKNIQQAYGSVLIGSKLQVDAGKFVTPVGAEVIESQDNWNYTRSILFGYAIPFYHTGIRATLTANDKLTLSGFVLNGWNNSSTINQGDPSLALGVTLKPSSKVTWIGNYMTGYELKETGAPRRNLFDTTLSVSLTEKLSVMGNFDYGKEGSTKWLGFAGYVKLQATEKWALVPRFEWIDDSEGGFMLLGTKGGSFTLTSDHLVAGALKARLEYRVDFADDPVFAKSGRTLKEKSQPSFAVGLVYAFGGKI
jgi:hypothetical protein